MSKVGQIERATQHRVIKLFKHSLDYRYLGNWIEKEDNASVEQDLLRAFLLKKGYNETLIDRAVYQFCKAAENLANGLYAANRDVYSLLRYGVKVAPEIGENKETVWLIDWEHPEENDFAIAEEVTVLGRNPSAFDKRPDIVLYVNGIALGILELKRSTVSISEGIRQNLDNQKREFIEPFFTTIQLVMAGSDSEGVRYGAIQTPEKYYLRWKEFSIEENVLDRDLLQICEKQRFLEIIHDFIVFDKGIKKFCRHNQYFGVKAAQKRVSKRVGGIIWHTQGSGKSLTMVWLAQWIRENVRGSRVLIITDRTELDEQIEGVFIGVGEKKIYRTKSGADLIKVLNENVEPLMCSVIHKFGATEDGEDVGDIPGFIQELRKALPKGFSAKGDFYVFVDECHRTQSGELHEAMKAILPNAMFIGFTGTPLLKADKRKSIEVFGTYIHTYKFDEAVKDKVVLDLRYEARDIEQYITSQKRIDEWFEVKTRGLNDVAKAELKKRWGTMKRVLSSQDRLNKIVADVLLDMETRPRLMSGHGNAILVAGSIYQACKLYELFNASGLAGKCAIVTSYQPTSKDLKGEEAGEGPTEKLKQYAIYQRMLADWFRESPEKAIHKVEKFEAEVKDRFINEPGQMKLLIVVQMLLTGFDAPPATYLYIDKQLQDHALFQAICRVNRLDGEDKEYGYIIDYKDLFKSLEGAVQDYTSGALDGYDKDDVEGLLEDRLAKAREDLEEAREAIKALCEPVEPPKREQHFFHYFCAKESGNAEQLKDNEQKRLTLYKLTASLIRAYTSIANEMPDAGYSDSDMVQIKEEVSYYESIRSAVKLNSGDYIDLKVYEPAMRHLIDTYIRAEDSKKISAFDDLSLVQLLVERGVKGIEALPDDIRSNKEAIAETIENNVRRLIIDEQPINPKYYEKMSELLDAIIDQRRKEAISYKKYLAEIVSLAKKVQQPSSGGSYPASLSSSAQRAIYDNIDRNASLAITLDEAIRKNLQDDWRNYPMRTRRVKLAIKSVLKDEELTDRILELAKHQTEY
jgi:type I restriction enzyme R subunit